MHFWDKFADRFCASLSFGFDSLTAYPDPDPETNTVDGSATVGKGPFSLTWANLIAKITGDASVDDGAEITSFQALSSPTSEMWYSVIRGFYLFNTDSLTSDVNISSATLSLYGSNKSDALSIAPDINIYSSNPAANNDLVNNDAVCVGSTPFSTAITYSGWSTTGYNDFSLNADGLNNISKIGVSKFSTRNANYDVAAIEPAWTVSAISNFKNLGSETTGTTQDPKLVVEYSAVTQRMLRNCNINNAGI
jgi:hypothetical protein